MKGLTSALCAHLRSRSHAIMTVMLDLAPGTDSSAAGFGLARSGKVRRAAQRLEAWGALPAGISLHSLPALATIIGERALP